MSPPANPYTAGHDFQAAAHDPVREEPKEQRDERRSGKHQDDADHLD
jgi:hypothetical protein